MKSKQKQILLVTPLVFVLYSIYSGIGLLREHLLVDNREFYSLNENGFPYHETTTENLTTTSAYR